MVTYQILTCPQRTAVFLCSFIAWFLFLLSIHTPSVLRDGFTSSLVTWMPFVSISCLIALVRTWSTILSRSRCWVGVVRVDTLVFFPSWESSEQLTAEYDVRCGLIIEGLSYVKMPSLCTQFVGSFYQERMLNFIKCFFFCMYWTCIFCSVDEVVYHINLHCFPRINYTWSWCTYF